MAGALTLMLLLAVSLTIVRSAGVALRLTGLPQDVARFQAISALTGAGYTTSESETTMRHPVRRRILMLLMLTGHLGVVTLASTVILAVTLANGVAGTFGQVIALIFAVGIVYLLAASETLDRLMCSLIERAMLRWDLIHEQPETVFYVHSNGRVLAEHLVGIDTTLPRETSHARILTLNDDPFAYSSAKGEGVSLKRGDRVLYIGDRSEHDALARKVMVRHSE